MELFGQGMILGLTIADAIYGSIAALGLTAVFAGFVVADMGGNGNGRVFQAAIIGVSVTLPIRSSFTFT